MSLLNKEFAEGAAYRRDKSSTHQRVGIINAAPPFRHLADKCNRSCKTQLSSGNASSSGKGSSGGSMACTCGNQTR